MSTIERPGRSLLATFLLFALAACGGGGGSTSKELVSISVTSASTSVTAGLMQQLSATGTYSDSSTANLTSTVTWSSATPANASVNAQSGLVTTIVVGSAKIVATLNSVSGSLALTVTPPTQGWALTSSPITSVYGGFTATLLADGTVLMAGGYGVINPAGSNPSMATAAIYNPVTGAWTSTGSMMIARDGHSATLLADGTVLVAGGESCTATEISGMCPLLASAEIYNPATGKWSATGNMTTATFEQLAVLLPTGMVLIAGGSTQCPTAMCNLEPSISAEIFDPVAGSWTATNAVQSGAGALTVLADGTALALGLSAPAAEIYNPALGGWASAAGPSFTADTATLLLGGSVLAAGGTTSCGLTLCLVNTVQIYTPSAGTWASAGAMNYARVHHTATLLKNGNVFVAGGTGCLGNCSIGPYSTLASAEIYDSNSGVWNEISNMIEARSGQPAILLSDGNMLVIGGDQLANPNGFKSITAEIYYP